MRKLLLLLLPIFVFASLQKVSVQLEWKHQFEFAGFYAAIEQGYYKEIGLDVELKEYTYGTNVSDDVINCVSTFGVSASSIILEKFRNKPIVLIGSYFKQNALGIVTSKNIKNINDLKNKKIMATEYELATTSIGVMLKENNITETDYTLIEHEFNSYKFINAEVDAMSIFITNELYNIEKANKDYNLFLPSDFGIYSYDVELFTSEKLIKKSPKMVKNFLEATNKGWEYAFAHKEEMVDLIYTKYTQRKSKAALLYEANKTEKIFKTDTFRIGSIVPELVELNAIIFKKLGLLGEHEKNLKQLLEGYIYFDSSIHKKINFTSQELKFLEENKIIKVANEMDWAPFDFNEFGKPTGLSIEYIKLILDKVGLQYEFVNGYTWAKLLDMYNAKKIDLIPAFYKNKEREKNTLFTTPYYHGKLAIISLTNSPIHSIHDLKNKNIGIEMSDASVPIVKKHLSKSKIIEYSTTAKLFQSLESNELDAIVCNPLLFKHHQKNLKNKNIHIVDEIEMTQEEHQLISLYIGVRKDYPLLYSIIQKSIYSLSEKEIQNLKKAWLDKESSISVVFTKEELEYLDKKTITMCVNPDRLPFEKLENNKHVGMSADFFKVMQKNINLNIKVIQTSTWSESIEFAKQRKCDLFSLAMSTAKKKEYMNFTSPYLTIPLVLATNLDVSFVADLSLIQDKKVGITQGYAFEEILRKKYPNLNIVAVKNIHDGLDQVKSGELFGYIGTLASIGYDFQTHYTGELKIAGKFDEDWEFGIGVRNDDLVLLSIMEKAINSVKENDRRSILNKWIAINYDKETDYDLTWQILIVSSIILLSTLYWARELSILNVQLQLAKVKADDATKEKANFLANMSHEIRTPMNSIVGMSYLLKETKLNDLQTDYVKKIENSSNNLLHLINDILDFSKMEARKLEIKKVNFNLIELINNVQNVTMTKAYEKDLKFITKYDKSSEVNLYADNIKLAQILTNLLSNAIKFTDKGQIELIIERINDTRLRFSVIDTGIGLSKEQKNGIFSSFTQADSSITRKYGGTGLGLAISKELVTLMNGRIWVESKLGEGSKFIFEVEVENSLEKITPHIPKATAITLNKEDKKVEVSKEEINALFTKLLDTATQRRPQLCLPVLEELRKYKLTKDDKKIFHSVDLLIKRYKFDDAKEILNAR